MQHSITLRGIGTLLLNECDTDLSSSTKGLLVPRMSTAQRLAIQAPAEGLLVFDLDMDQFFYFNNQTWITFLGSVAGINDSNQSLAIGDSALLSNSNLYGINNTALGIDALHFNTTGTDNVAIAVKALYSNTSGDYNIGIGPSSLYSNTAGNSNIAIGFSALNLTFWKFKYGYTNTTGTKKFQRAKLTTKT